MNKPITIALSALFATGAALAQGHPANFARPVDFPAKEAGPAKAAEGTKLATSNCEAKAVSKDGKPLSGDAKTAFIKKCEADAKAAKAAKAAK
jgi:hypothetical protein